MKLIVGLGNPGRKYEKTRHNLGFMLVDRLAEVAGADFSRKECEALTTKTSLSETICVLAKPQTFMNLSGKAVQCLVKKYCIDPSADLLIVSDEIALPMGRIRMRAKGSAGGHNGLKSIISLIGQDFARLRLGIKPEAEIVDLADFVLDRFDASEKEALEHMLERGVQAVEVWLQRGIEKAIAVANA